MFLSFRFAADFSCSPHKYPDVGFLENSSRLFGCFFIQQIGLFTISTGTKSRFGFSWKMLFGWCLFSNFSLLRLFFDCKFEFLRLFRRRHAQKVKLKNDENEIKTLMLFSLLLSALCTSSVCTWLLVSPWRSVYCVKSTYKSLRSGRKERENLISHDSSNLVRVFTGCKLNQTQSWICGRSEWKISLAETTNFTIFVLLPVLLRCLSVRKDEGSVRWTFSAYFTQSPPTDMFSLKKCSVARKTREFSRRAYINNGKSWKL